jgi:hypothetical protein
MINAQPANMNVIDYCAAMDRNEIIVNREYQRSDKVWPDAAKSYLIETILLQYPIPKLYLQSKADPKTRKTIKEIVDGQQRSRTIHDFLNDKFSLANTLDTEELRGFKYSTLTDDWQGKFLSYLLSIDQLIGATPSEVRQVFRRMNSYTVPLNPEELRHAQNQGAFKWFIARLGTEYTDKLLRLKIFTEKNILRMQDLKLYTEIVHAIMYGVSTTNKEKLDKIYRDNDKSFDQEGFVKERIEPALGLVGKLDFLEDTNLSKPYQVYSLALAFVRVISERVNPAERIEELFNMDRLEGKLTEMSAELDSPIEEIRNPLRREFVEASTERTNVKEQRERRIEALCNAIRESLVEK